MLNRIGKSVPRKEGRKKVTGQALYVDDLTFPDMLHGTTVRSPLARGRIRSISFEGDLPWDEFVVVTAKDIPGANHVTLILEDQPYLAADYVNHPEEPVVLLAHKDKYLLEEARRRVKIDFDELPPLDGGVDPSGMISMRLGRDLNWARWTIVGSSWAKN